VYVAMSARLKGRAAAWSIDLHVEPRERATTSPARARVGLSKPAFAGVSN
jgi:hypothetical protein